MSENKLGGIHVGSQKAEKIINYQVTITDPKDLATISSSLIAMKEEILKIDLPNGVNKEKLLKPVEELINNKESQQDKNVIKEKIEKFNDNLSLVDKTIKGIETIAPYALKIAKIIGISGWLGL